MKASFNQGTDFSVKNSGRLNKVTDAISMNTRYKSILLSLGIWQLVREVRQLGHSIVNYLKVKYVHLIPYAETKSRCIKKVSIFENQVKEIENNIAYLSKRQLNDFPCFEFIKNTQRKISTNVTRIFEMVT